MGFGDFLKAFLEKLGTRAVILCLLLVPALTWVVACFSPDIAKQLKHFEAILLVAFLFGLVLLVDQIWNLQSAKSRAQKGKQAADNYERGLRDRWKSLTPFEQQLLRQAHMEGDSIDSVALKLQGRQNLTPAGVDALTGLNKLGLAEYQQNGRYVVSQHGYKLMLLLLADEQDELLKKRLEDTK